jgi:hypothetical protein
VVTSGTDIRIDSFEPVTPAQLVVSDVAWADETRLSVIAASTASAGSAQVWRVNSDGSHRIPISNSGLPPGSPSAIAEQNGQTLVSASGAIWAHASETAQSWTIYPATRTSPQPGTNPIFAE